MKQLSVQALASMANVSVSSIERIERGESVTDQILRNVAVALHQNENSFIAERVHLTHAETLRELENDVAAFDGTVQVPVRHFTKQRQIRELSRCHIVILVGFFPQDHRPLRRQAPVSVRTETDPISAKQYLRMRVVLAR